MVSVNADLASGTTTSFSARYIFSSFCPLYICEALTTHISGTTTSYNVRYIGVSYISSVTLSMVILSWVYMFIVYMYTCIYYTCLHVYSTHVYMYKIYSTFNCAVLWRCWRLLCRGCRHPGRNQPIHSNGGGVKTFLMPSKVSAIFEEKKFQVIFY